MNKTLTVFAVTSQKTPEHFAAIQKTLAALPFKAESMLVTKPPWHIANFNKFMVVELPDYIHTDFVLTVHWDGYALNPKFWNDGFLQYDYIGAPWPKTILKEFVADPNCMPNWVGNGGFSLRSRKWLEATRLLAPRHTHHNEDIFFCRMNASHFINRGCKIAPFEVAQRFSFELPTEGYPNPSRSFGFHGVKAMRMLGL